MKNKNKTYRAGMHSTMLIDSKSSHLEYTKARNKVRTMVRQAKREFEKGIAAQAKINLKRFWSELKFEEHISAKIRVANAIVSLICHSFTFLDGIMFKRLYAPTAPT